MRKIFCLQPLFQVIRSLRRPRVDSLRKVEESPSPHDFYFCEIPHQLGRRTKQPSKGVKTSSKTRFKNLEGKSLLQVAVGLDCYNFPIVFVTGRNFFFFFLIKYPSSMKPWIIGLQGGRSYLRAIVKACDYVDRDLVD